MNTTEDIINQLEVKMTIDGMARSRGYAIPGVIVENDASGVYISIARRQSQKKMTTASYAAQCVERLNECEILIRMDSTQTWLGTIVMAKCLIAGGIEYMYTLTTAENEDTFVVYAAIEKDEQNVKAAFSALLQAIKEERL